MKAKEWLNLMQKASDYDPNMTSLIEKYGELLVAEEVEKRIAERMPSEEKMDAEVDKRYSNIENPHIFGKQLGFGDCYFWLLSRLTKPGAEPIQKTEGGTNDKG